MSAGSYGQFLHENNLISDAQLFNFTEAFRTLYVPLVEEEKWEEALKVDNQLLEDISAAAGVPNNFNIRQPSQRYEIDVPLRLVSLDALS